MAKFKCDSCRNIWQADKDEQTNLAAKFVFFNHKKYTGESQIFPPSKLMLHVTEQMEQVFRGLCAGLIKGTDVKRQLVAAIDGRVHFENVVCSMKCLAVINYMKELYVMMRLNYYIKLQNRSLKDKKCSNNKSCKLMKISHV